MCNYGSLSPEFLRPGCNPTKHPATQQANEDSREESGPVGDSFVAIAQASSMAKDDRDWRVPNAPTRSLRGLLIMAAALIRRSATHPILGLLRADIRELKEMRFQ